VATSDAPAVAKAPPPSAAPGKAPTTEEEKLAAASVVTTPAENAMDEMIDDALAHPKAKGGRAPAPAPAAVPLAPSRDDVVKAMGTLVPAIRGCAQGQSGLAPMTIVVKNDGHVESAALSGGPFQGTASGGCMEGVVRRARFPRFQQASFRVQFPFAIQ
jgi:hypothetical protein